MSELEFDETAADDVFTEVAPAPEPEPEPAVEQEDRPKRGRPRKVAPARIKILAETVSEFHRGQIVSAADFQPGTEFERLIANGAIEVHQD